MGEVSWNYQDYTAAIKYYTQAVFFTSVKLKKANVGIFI